MPLRLKVLARQLGPSGILFVVLLALYAVLAAAASTSGWRLLVLVLLYGTGLIFGIRILRRNLRQILWRLRNRLIVAYLFIAVVPILLIGILVAAASYVLVGQIALYLVNSELERRTEALNAPAQFLAETPALKRQSAVEQVAPYLQGRFPDVEIVIRDGGLYRHPPTATATPPPPGWKDTNGLVLRDGSPCSWAHATKGGTEATIIAPLTSDLLAELAPDIGEVFLGPVDVQQRPAKKMPVRASRSRHVNRIPEAASRFDIQVTLLTPVVLQSWEAPGTLHQGALIVYTRPSAVLRVLFGKIEYSQTWLIFFLLVTGIFFIVELISLRIGVSISRTITQAVQALYEGTQHVKAADFSHRIGVQGNDQLAELARSFNGMTENLERLIVVEKEQERLKSEIAIAREVQSQLFPRGAPEMKTLELMGVCHPARMVSGDYYDFIRLQDSTVALAIGDVAGKGISAALLMAALQSIMRTQLTAGISVQAAASHGGGGVGHAPFSTAELVSQLNKQVYATTSPEKYATFYFGLYDDDTRLLRYTNAGHLQPVLMRDGHAERLEVTGTVVGAFPVVAYEEKTIALRRGDLLVAFTDGIVEPENEYGEPFGEDRLIELLVGYGQRESKEIIARIMETVEQWTGTAELPDDMTVVLARGV
jgi:sigma-B regulation protein RsbU (phosphoserine phosphatase)